MSAQNAAVQAWEDKRSDLLETMIDAFYQLGRHEKNAAEPGSLDEALAAKRAFVAHLGTTPEGWQLVPVEPTEAISRVLRNEGDIYPSEDALYAALLSAVKEGGAG